MVVDGGPDGELHEAAAGKEEVEVSRRNVGGMSHGLGECHQGKAGEVRPDVGDAAEQEYAGEHGGRADAVLDPAVRHASAEEPAVVALLVVDGGVEVAEDGKGVEDGDDGFNVDGKGFDVGGAYGADCLIAAERGVSGVVKSWHPSYLRHGEVDGPLLGGECDNERGAGGM